MKRIAVLVTILWVAGCGEGPKHLSKSDYENGKAVFERLQQFEQMPKDSLSSEGAVSALVDAGAGCDDLKNASLRRDLRDYSIAILWKAEASHSEKLADQSPAPDESYSTASERKGAGFKASMQLWDLAPIIKRCHNDAAQYFDARALNTNTCHEKLVRFEKEHKGTSLVDAD